jgi:thiol-disulfide isomerase/thioredoxin
MWVSIAIGTVLAVTLIVVVSLLTGGAVRNQHGLSTALVGEKVTSFTLGGLNGGTERAPWDSGHPSALIFFASYCGPCRGEMPKVATYLRRHDESPVVVMGIDASDQRSSAQTMLRKDDVTFPIAFDPNAAVTTGIFKFEDVPETVFVTGHGVVTEVYFGAIPVDQLKSGLASLRS